MDTPEQQTAQEPAQPINQTLPPTESTDPVIVQSPTQPPIKKSNPNTKKIGIVLAGILIAGLLLFGGYYLGTFKKSAEVSPSPTPTQVKIVDPTDAPEKAAPTPEESDTKIIKGGLTDSSTSFKPYSIEVPEGWTDKTVKTSVSDKLIISKEGYSINILQAAIGGGGCVYKGDPPAELAQSFTDFSQIAGSSNQYRRSWNQDAAAKNISYTVCQKHPTENSYGAPTTYGAISVTSPNPADAKTMAEIDEMISSITKQ